MLCVDDAVRAVTGTVVQPLKDPVQCRGELGDPIRVLVVDDNPVVLDGAEGIVGLGRCTSGDEVVEMAAGFRLGVVAMDMDMPELSASEAFVGIGADPLRPIPIRRSCCTRPQARRCPHRPVAVLEGAVMWCSKRTGRSTVGMLVG